MNDCKYLPSCAIFNRFRLDGIKNFWIRIYCQGDKQPRCARRAILEQGESPSERLLPNGELLAETDS